jgi:hypothetical protein
VGPWHGFGWANVQRNVDMGGHAEPNPFAASFRSKTSKRETSEKGIGILRFPTKAAVSGINSFAD